MQPFNRILLSTALILAIFGSGVVAFSSIAFASTNSARQFAVSKVNPAAVSRTALGDSESVVVNASNVRTAKRNPYASATPRCGKIRTV